MLNRHHAPRYCQVRSLRMGGMSIRNNIARIGATALISCGLVATTVPATFADEAAQEISFTYADSARLITPAHLG